MEVDPVVSVEGFEGSVGNRILIDRLTSVISLGACVAAAAAQLGGVAGHLRFADNVLAKAAPAQIESGATR